jgi:hypothetical protein
VGAGLLSNWVTKYLKAPVCIWKGALPQEWE